MSELFAGNGSLSEKGLDAAAPLEKALEEILSTYPNLSISELRILGSNLAKIVGDTISDAVQLKMDEKKKTGLLWEMSDSQFERYLVNKYGYPSYLFTSLTIEEFERAQAIEPMR